MAYVFRKAIPGVGGSQGERVESLKGAEDLWIVEGAEKESRIWARTEHGIREDVGMVGQNCPWL